MTTPEEGYENILATAGDAKTQKLKVGSVKEFEVKNQYGKWEVVLNNPHAKRITFLMVGDRQKGFIPSPKMFKECSDAVQLALDDKDGDRLIITHPFLSVLQVDLPEGPIIMTTPHIAPEKMHLSNPEHLERLRRDSDRMASEHDNESVRKGYRELANSLERLTNIITYEREREVAKK